MLDLPIPIASYFSACRMKCFPNMLLQSQAVGQLEDAFMKVRIILILQILPGDFSQSQKVQNKKIALAQVYSM
jgi:hypothetical protein